jgi:hypothetical protein
MPRRLVRLALVSAGLALAAPLARATPPDLTADEFKLYREYQDAATDVRVQKVPEQKRLAVIAKNFKLPEKKLAETVRKGEAAGAGLAAACEAEVKAQLGSTSLNGRVGEVTTDTSHPHVVTYVSWTNEDGGKLEEEAALAALSAAKGAPVTSTVALWATDVTGRKVFEAKISADAAGRFNRERIGMFASARYIKQFEDVKNAYKGAPPAN